MVITVLADLRRCFERFLGEVFRNLSCRKMARISMVKLWLVLVGLTLTVFLLMNITLDVKESGANRKIHRTQSLAKVIIGRISDGLSLLDKSRGKPASPKNAADYYGVQNGYFIWNGKHRPWFMKNGTLRPDPKDPMYSGLIFWPTEQIGSSSDRIVNQLMFVPHNYSPELLVSRGQTKKIFISFDPGAWGGGGLPQGRQIFLDDECPVNTCELTFRRRDRPTAHAVLFKDRFYSTKRKPPHQIWILYLLECPLHTPPFRGLNRLINWTATYRHDSDIVAPYEKFVSYSSDQMTRDQLINYAAGKRQKVAWFVSNCAAHNNRLEYAKELRKYIQVDIYGRCGNKECPRGNQDGCYDLLNRDYKFYLAFENSNCHDYITEKLFSNGLSNKILPIVMGARPEDYLRSAPPNSYLHVNDFASPRELAEYLKKLDANDTLYNQYFQWKGTGEFINTRFWCRLCAMLHLPERPKSYESMASWWDGPSMCQMDSGGF